MVRNPTESIKKSKGIARKLFLHKDFNKIFERFLARQSISHQFYTLNLSINAFIPLAVHSIH